MRTALALAAALLAGCSDDETGDIELDLVEVGDPTFLRLAPGRVVHSLCLVGDVGATATIAGAEEGTFDRTSARLLGTEPLAGCPPRELAGRTNGWAVFEWRTTDGNDDIAVFQANGPVISAPEDVHLVGQAFDGYEIMLVGTPTVDAAHATFELSIAYRTPGSPETTPAARVPFSVSTIPELERTFPAGEDDPVTDRDGKATLAFAAPMQETQVIVTATGGDPEVVTTLDPEAEEP